MLKKLFLYQILPYNRCFLHIEVDSRIYIIPAIKAGVFFLQNGDTFVIDDIDILNKLKFIDYSVVDNKYDNTKKFYEDFQNFKDFVKNHLMQNESLIIHVNKKFIYQNNCYLDCSVS